MSPLSENFVLFVVHQDKLNFKAGKQENTINDFDVLAKHALRAVIQYFQRLQFLKMSLLSLPF